MMKRLFNRTFAVAVGLSVMCMPVHYTGAASVVTSSLSVAANITAFCTVTNATMNFGSYEPITQNATRPLDVTSDFDITCTKGSSATIGLDNGLNSTKAHGTTRAMSAGGASRDYISYELYLNAGRSTVWNMTNVENFVASNKQPRRINVYGRIPAGQDVGAGFYSDTVTIRANF